VDPVHSGQVELVGSATAGIRACTRDNTISMKDYIRTLAITHASECRIKIQVATIYITYPGFGLLLISVDYSSVTTHLRSGKEVSTFICHVMVIVDLTLMM
jgi:hypothetical protein